ncbi:MAG: hypothetical protein M4579_002081 [Chaenotheca gracillima]|nr:MAG: hypothetical protein M4579_002081 [Chaenotheca gracillima]
MDVDGSRAGAAKTAVAPGPEMTRPIIYLPTVEAYDRWAEVYDTDNNILQGVDDHELASLLPRFLNMLSESPRIVDLGCGTGRNTIKLIGAGRTIVGLDASPKMLDIARGRCESQQAGMADAPDVCFEVYDALTTTEIPPHAVSADAVVSTLVIEHVPIVEFFTVASKMLKPGGLLLLTNMHPDMGAQSQAGFVDPVSGEKIRPKSYVHRIEDVVEGAATLGLSVVGEVSQRSVREEDLEGLGPRARKWLGTQVWFGAIFTKSTGS